MKKLLVMLLAVSMVLTMTFALASCGGDDKPADESKVTSSEDSAASSEDSAASSEDSAVSSEDTAAPSEDDSTSEDSVDVESTEEPSEDSSEPDDTSAPSGNYVTTPTKTNYALGKTYTLTRDATDTDPNYLYLSYSEGSTKWSDVELKKMTDGNVGDITNESYANPQVAALEGVTVQLVGTNKLFEYIFDLGEYYGDIKSFVFRNVRHGIPNGANRGFKLRLAYVSDDGVNWTKLNGKLDSATVPGAPEFKNAKDDTIVNVEHFNFTYTLTEAAKGKFVRLCLVSDGGYVIQLEEIEIWN